MSLTLKRLLGAVALLVAGVGAAGLAQAADVGVSVSISQPGVYGRVDIGRFPYPEVIVQQPVIVHRTVRVREPVYMWVPAGHRKNWSRHCGRYGACGAPVYFVRDGWYEQKLRHPPGFRGDWKHDGWHRDDGWRDHRHGRHDRRDRYDRYDRDGRHDGDRYRRGGRHGRDDD
jgi:hypothetical protein